MTDYGPKKSAIGYEFTEERFKRLLTEGINNLKTQKDIHYTLDRIELPAGLLFLYDDPIFKLIFTYVGDGGDYYTVIFDINWPNILSDNYFINVKAISKEVSDNLDWEALIVLKILYLLYKTSHNIDTAPSKTFEGIFRIQDRDELIAEIEYQLAI